MQCCMYVNGAENKQTTHQEVKGRHESCHSRQLTVAGVAITGGQHLLQGSSFRAAKSAGVAERESLPPHVPVK